MHAARKAQGTPDWAISDSRGLGILTGINKRNNNQVERGSKNEDRIKSEQFIQNLWLKNFKRKYRIFSNF